MEQNLHELNINGLNMKLTSEKLFVNSATSNETFALRSVNGIGIVDLVDKYNQELVDYKKKMDGPKGCGIISLIFGIFLFFGSISALGSNDNGVIFIFFIAIFLLVIGGIILYNLKNKRKPNLKSAVRIMLTGMSRDFEFDKKSTDANEVAKFVALVEDTLTSYHSKN